VENTVSISDVSNYRLSLFDGKVLGADVAGNTLEVTVERVANDGDDDAQNSAVTLHTVDIGVSRRSVSSGSQSSNFSVEGD
jgi:hypothetical protein